MIRLIAIAGLVAFACTATAQDNNDYTARLSWVPISGSERGNVAGSGEAEATLERSRLTISGRFEQLPGTVTLATLRHGPATGARGPVVAELEISGGRSGEFSGEISLDRAEREALLAGHLYLQVHAEGGVPPDGAVLMGWLLADSGD